MYIQKTFAIFASDIGEFSMQKNNKIRTRKCMDNAIVYNALPDGYAAWQAQIVSRIQQAKYQAMIGVNAELLSLYWHIGQDILQKQEDAGWGAQVILQLSKDLQKHFPEDRGFSARNLRNMKRFAESYPTFPILQVPLAEINEQQIWQVPLAELRNVSTGESQVTETQSDIIWQVGLAKLENDTFNVRLDRITWYHHISLLSKVSDVAERAFYIMETARNGWSRDVMLTQVSNGYIHAKGNAINNFSNTLPAYQSDLARDTFKDPYNFGFLGSVALQNELDIERQLTQRITDFLLEMGRGFSFVGRQYHLSVDGDDYYIDILMYHLQLHCYVVVELKAVEFIPEFVSKLNFYISAVDEYVKSPEDKPTIGLLLCRSKSDTKARFALRGITQPMGIAEYETQKLFADVASALPQIDDIEIDLDDKKENN